MRRRKEDYLELKSRREKKRINDLMIQVRSNNGQINTREIANLWNIPVRNVQSEVDRLVVRYKLPITQIEQGYPIYHFEGHEDFDLFQDAIEEEQPQTEQLLYPDPEKTQIDTKFCSNCGSQVKGDRFCGNCGYDLKSTK